MAENQQLSLLKKQIQKLESVQTIPQLVRCFLQNQKPPCLYFKWLSDLSAFKLTDSRPLAHAPIIRLWESDPSFKIEQLNDPFSIPSLARIVQSISGGQKMFHYLASFKEQPFGLFFLSEKNIFTDIFFQAFQIKCQALTWKKQCVQFSNRNHLLKILFSEISRARKLQRPVSLLVIRCLSDEAVSNKGEDKNLPIFFKSLYSHLAKNMAHYDSIVQINPQEMALVLPHICEEEACEKAGKIDWVLKSLDYQEIFSRKDILFQIGVAEYPKTARDAVSLLKMAGLACEHSQKGGVCVASALAQFKPDFETASPPL